MNDFANISFVFAWNSCLWRHTILFSFIILRLRYLTLRDEIAASENKFTQKKKKKITNSFVTIIAGFCRGKLFLRFDKSENLFCFDNKTASCHQMLMLMLMTNKYFPNHFKNWKSFRFTRRTFNPTTNRHVNKIHFTQPLPWIARAPTNES